MARRVFEVIGRPEMIEDPRFNSNTERVRNRLLVDEAVGAWFAGKGREASITFFTTGYIVHGPGPLPAVVPSMMAKRPE